MNRRDFIKVTATFVATLPVASRALARPVEGRIIENAADVAALYFECAQNYNVFCGAQPADAFEHFSLIARGAPGRTTFGEWPLTFHGFDEGCRIFLIGEDGCIPNSEWSLFYMRGSVEADGNNLVATYGPWTAAH